MSTQKPISAEEMKGRQLAFQVWEANLSGNKATFETERNFYLSVPVLEEKPQELISLELVRSQTAQLRELRKEQEQVLTNEEKIQAALELTKSTVERYYPKELC